MKAQILKCPSCEAALEMEDGIDTFYCKYCGYKIMLTEISDISIDAKVQMKRMEHQERMRDKQYEQERYQLDKKEQSNRNEAKKKALFCAGIALVCILYYLLATSYLNSAKQKSMEEEKQLQAIVDEVIVDIKNGDFDEAYVKANTIHYTSNWSHDVEKKWDGTREALLDRIEQAENGTEGTESDAGGFFDWFD